MFHQYTHLSGGIYDLYCACQHKPLKFGEKGVYSYHNFTPAIYYGLNLPMFLFFTWFLFQHLGLLEKIFGTLFWYWVYPLLPMVFGVLEGVEHLIFMLVVGATLLWGYSGFSIVLFIPYSWDHDALLHNFWDSFSFTCLCSVFTDDKLLKGFATLGVIYLGVSRGLIFYCLIISPCTPRFFWRWGLFLSIIKNVLWGVSWCHYIYPFIYKLLGSLILSLP